MLKRFRLLCTYLAFFSTCTVCTSAWSQTGETDRQNSSEQVEQSTAGETQTEDLVEPTDFYDAEYDYGYSSDEIFDVNAYGGDWDYGWYDDYSYTNDWYYTDSWYEDDGVFDDWYYE